MQVSEAATSELLEELADIVAFGSGGDRAGVLIKELKARVENLQAEIEELEDEVADLEDQVDVSSKDSDDACTSCGQVD